MLGAFARVLEGVAQIVKLHSFNPYLPFNLQKRASLWKKELMQVPVVCLPGSIFVSGKLPTYPSPNLTLPLTSHFGQNVRFGTG